MPGVWGVRSGTGETKFSQLVKRSPCLLVGGNCSIFSKVNILEARGEPAMENNLVIISYHNIMPMGGSRPSDKGGGGGGWGAVI